MANFRYSMILEIVDRASAPARKFKRAFGQMRSDFKAVSNAATRSGRSVEFFDRRAQRLGQMLKGRGLQTMGAGLRVIADRAISAARNVAALTGRLKLAERAGYGLGRGVRWGLGKVLDMAKWGAAGVVGAGGFALFDMFKTAGQFEQYQIMLEGMMGSAAKGKASMGWITKFAKDTPFELDEVTNAFLVLKNSGLDPTNGSLKSAGDAAAGMSKDIGQAAEAVADAMTGEFERLKELGITASVAGKQVTLSWIKNEKSFSKVVNMGDRVGVAMAVAAAWSDKFAGSTDKQSRSMFGIVSNLKDLWSGFMVMIANAGIFDRVKAKLQEWQDRINAMGKDGRLQAWAKQISDWLEKAFNWGIKFAEQTDWNAVASGMGAIVSTLVNVVALLGKAVELAGKFQRWKAGNRAYELESTENSWFASASRKADARRQRMGLEQAYGPLTETGRAEADAAKARGARWKAQQKIGGGGWPRAGVPAMLRAPAGRGAPYRPLSAAGKTVLRQRETAQVGGKVTVEVKAAPGTTARVASVSSSNRAVPVQAKVGNVMRGAA